jgi:GT2 family glycosyltransferase
LETTTALPRSSEWPTLESLANKVTTPVSIVIPNWNGLEFLERFLSSVIAAANRYNEQSGAPTEIVIVDDGSVDKSVEWLRGKGFEEESQRSDGAERASKRGSALRLIRNETNRGFGPTCNRGFETAIHPLVFLINNDVEVQVDAIAPLAENFSDDLVFAAHCRVFDVESKREIGTGKLGSFSRGFIRVHRSYVCLEENCAENRALYSIFASGGSAMFDRRKFLEIGKFDRLFAPIYWEDVDISYRAWKRGLSILYEPRSIVRHRVSSTMRKIGRRRMRQLQQRNRLIFHWINLHDRVMLTSNVIWVGGLALTAVFRLQPDFILSLASALKRLPEIRRRRLEEKRASKRSDREVFNIFRLLERRTDLFAYDDYSELEAMRERR